MPGNSTHVAVGVNAPPLKEADGFTDATLDAAESTLGVRLPAAVREAYRFLGRRDDLTSRNGTLYPPDELSHDTAADVLVFRAAHQSIAYHGILLADAANPDPPVLLYVTYADKSRESWKPFMQRFSLACVEMVPWETIEAGWIALAARTPEALDAFRRTHPGDWVNE